MPSTVKLPCHGGTRDRDCFRATALRVSRPRCARQATPRVREGKTRRVDCLTDCATVRLWPSVKQADAVGVNRSRLWQNWHMSTGLFMGIRSSFVEEAQDAASAFIAAIDRALADRDLPPYLDPAEPPNIYTDHLFGRSALDHHSSRVLVDIANFGSSVQEHPNLGLIRDNPFRVAFLPIRVLSSIANGLL